MCFGRIENGLLEYVFIWLYGCINILHINMCKYKINSVDAADGFSCVFTMMLSSTDSIKFLIFSFVTVHVCWISWLLIQKLFPFLVIALFLGNKSFISILSFGKSVFCSTTHSVRCKHSRVIFKLTVGVQANQMYVIWDTSKLTDWFALDHPTQ